MRRWVAGGLVLSGLWVFVRGAPLEPAGIVAELLTGLVIAMPLAFVFRRFYQRELHAAGLLTSIPPALRYLASFLYQLLTANVDVAYRVLHPSLPITPDVIELPLRVESDLAITTIANSITLTPGTLTMDYDEERNALYVHVMFVPDRESVVAPIRRWEDLALRIFDEPRDPDDPVPRPPRGEQDGE
jgi:multicomponent Na+:H+ antiporter subunit E